MGLFKKTLKAAFLPVDYILSGKKVAGGLHVASFLFIRTMKLAGSFALTVFDFVKTLKWHDKVLSRKADEYRAEYATNQDMPFIIHADRIETVYISTLILCVCLFAGAIWFFIERRIPDAITLLVFFTAIFSVHITAISYFVTMNRLKMYFPFSVFVSSLLMAEKKAWFPLGVKNVK